MQQLLASRAISKLPEEVQWNVRVLLPRGQDASGSAQLRGTLGNLGSVQNLSPGVLASLPLAAATTPPANPMVCVFPGLAHDIIVSVSYGTLDCMQPLAAVIYCWILVQSGPLGLQATADLLHWLEVKPCAISSATSWCSTAAAGPDTHPIWHTLWLEL